MVGALLSPSASSVIACGVGVGDRAKATPWSISSIATALRGLARNDRLMTPVSELLPRTSHSARIRTMSQHFCRLYRPALVPPPRLSRQCSGFDQQGIVHPHPRHLFTAAKVRSEKRRVGHEGVSTCRFL